MNWIFPIAGKGIRVKLLGSFKPFVKVKKKIIEWFLIGIKNKFKNKDKLYFITTVDFEKNYQVSLNIKKILKNLKIKNKLNIVLLNQTPNGPGMTVANIIKILKGNKPCAVVNPDQVVDFEMPEKIYKDKIYIPIYYNNTGNSSYARIDKKNRIKNIYEKKQISFFASSGVYIFGSVKCFKKCFDLLNLNVLKKKEINLSDFINNFIKKNKNTFAIPLQTYLKYDLGEVKKIKYFKYLIERYF